MKKIYNFLTKAPSHIPVVLDQAYFEYLNINDQAIDWLKEFGNLIITRTFSKAYGLAGCRVGFIIANKTLAQRLYKYRSMYEINSIGVTPFFLPILIE